VESPVFSAAGFATVPGPASPLAPAGCAGPPLFGATPPGDAGPLGEPAGDAALSPALPAVCACLSFVPEGTVQEQDSQQHEKAPTTSKVVETDR